MNPHINDITVFIISAGEDTTTACEEALANQDCTFTIKHIRDTFPMSSAFQRMPDECDTKYFIQVDSDMILKSHAIQSLYNGIKHTTFMTYMAFGQLYEEDIGISGAVKCWKSSLFKYFKFKDCRTVDRNLYRRTLWIGLRRKDMRQILGFHIARQSSFTRYLKTKSDIEKRRFLKVSHKRHDVRLLNTSIEGLPVTRHELFGALLGVLTTKERLVRSKDTSLEIQRYDELLNYLGLNQSLPEVIKLEVDIPDLKKLFYKSYREISSNYNHTKLALADMIIKIFGRKPIADSSGLLEILSR